MQSTSNRAWPADVCRSCGGSRGARRVVTSDELGDPVCLVCRGRDLAGLEGEVQTALDLLAALVRHAVSNGMTHPDDLARRIGEAVAEGERLRELLELRPTRTAAQIDDAIAALRAVDRPDGEED
jgi:hypothetical protein